jgi:hypothetical protein
MYKQRVIKPQELLQEVIPIRGQDTIVPAVHIAGQTVVCTGKNLRMAMIKDEELVEGEPVADPGRFALQLKASGFGADIFTFVQKPHAAGTRQALYYEDDNFAVLPTHSFKDWWDQLPQESRKNVRRAAKRGIVVKEVPFDDELVRGIKDIYDETPVRQGRTFWHYGKDLETVKSANSTYLQRSWFVGAFHKEELIGFLRVIMVDRIATIIQILAKNAHHDKRPMNALLSHTVELCAQRGASLLVYGKFSYGKKGADSLAEFKRRNGFKEVTVPRYYVPLTLKGRIALKLGLHRGLAHMIPRPVADFLLAGRALVLRRLVRLRGAGHEALRNGDTKRGAT